MPLTTNQIARCTGCAHLIDVTFPCPYCQPRQWAAGRNAAPAPAPEPEPAPAPEKSPMTSDEYHESLVEAAVVARHGLTAHLIAMVVRLRPGQVQAALERLEASGRAHWRLFSSNGKSRQAWYPGELPPVRHPQRFRGDEARASVPADRPETGGGA